MGDAIIETFKTYEEALEYVNNSKDKKRLVVFYEPEFCKNKPYTVNLD